MGRSWQALNRRRNGCDLGSRLNHLLFLCSEVFGREIGPGRLQGLRLRLPGQPGRHRLGSVAQALGAVESLKVAADSVGREPERSTDLLV